MNVSKGALMLRLKHALPLVLLVSASAFAMEQQLVVASQSATPAASPLMETVLVLKTHEEQKQAYETSQKNLVAATAQRDATEAALKQSSAQMMATIAAKRVQIDGSTKTLDAYANQLAELKAKAAQEEAALKEKNAKAEADLQAKIAAEEKIKQGNETTLAGLEAQVAPKEEPKVFGPEQAPKAESKSLFKWLFGSK